MTGVAARRRRNWRAWWAKQLIAWHWISAGVSLAAMLLFAITGITLNHAGAISAEPVVAERTAQLPGSLLRTLTAAAATKGTIPVPVATDIERQVALDVAGRPVEWSDGEAYVALPRPGGDAWVSIDLTSGAIRAEMTDRGWISYLNDLHKGRNAGSAWFWFIDVFAIACVLFSITGLLLLQLHAKRRPSTWPLVAGGVALPVVLAVFLIH
ncbi:PepSY-associated TM helix domain-containing protein [Sphingomonas sp. 2R-10]|uniref:PepSY-associated TM helix domain-containing protein n=1 Tax=Sphingomonas sp. 2R-10 TaxID=3045148 RepID=UPI000F7AA644|nr:PepSY-associated TM helix domain-containing protein [Sphingomonas sp. 2R-10]MDJ0277586.1 PepSY-associated TM helix domain-containing protein [Sphingomonas sp. 2R-10]